MPHERDTVHLWDMLQAARGVMRATRGLTFEQYVADENLRLSVERRRSILMG